MPSYVVTGATRGLGLEFVSQLSRPSGNTVFALVRSKETAGKLLVLGRGNVHVLEDDITDVQALKLAAKEVAKVTSGKLDVLINNAVFSGERSGFNLDEYPDGREDLLEEDFRKSFNVNVIGVNHTTNIHSSMRVPSRKSSLSLQQAPTSISHTGLSQNSPYSISKAALNLAVARYAVEHKKDGFLFLALSPGLVNTRESLSMTTEEELKKYESMVASFRKVKPDLSGPITPEQSVSMLLDVIDKASLENTGAFLSHKGNREWL